MNKWVLLAALFLATPVHAAKVMVVWMNPTTRMDGTALTDLASIRIEWGTCAGNQFGELQSSITVAAGLSRAPIYPSKLTRVCVRAFAITSEGVQSVASNVSSKDLLPSTGKPVKLDQPIIIEF